MRVLLVDDHKLVSEMLADALGEAEEIEVVGTASNGAEGLDLAKRSRRGEGWSS